MKYFDNLRKYFAAQGVLSGLSLGQYQRQQTIRQPGNSDNNGRWHFLGIIDCDDHHPDHDFNTAQLHRARKI